MSADTVILSTSQAGRGDRRMAWGMAVVSAAIFLAVAPFAQLPLARVWAFIPAYQAALVVTDLVTAVLLLAQFNISRARALLVLACGYVFTACMAVAHALTFPGLFTPGGLLGANPQSTAWLYVFWHGGFPLFVMAYTHLHDRPRAAALLPLRRMLAPVLGGLAGVIALTCAFVVLATDGVAALPPIMAGHQYAGTRLVVIAATWLLTALAMVAVGRRHPKSVLDLWLLVVMTAWLFDIALSALLNAGRFDVGFYAGRIYGLLAASFVLVMLLLENGRLYARLVLAHERVGRTASDAQQLSTQLAEANAMLAEQNRRLEEASRLKSEFLSSMSHELRTPLNAVIGFSEVMKDGLAGPLTPQQGGYVGHIFQSGQHLLALINDILDLSKIEAGKVEMEVLPVDLDALLAESIAFMSEKARTAQVRLSRQALEPAGVVLADRRRLKQIVYNLLANAVKFTPAQGQVVLEHRLVDRSRAASAMPGFAHGMRMPLPDNEHQVFVEISVSDTGIGISPDDARHLFTPFTQIGNQLTRQIEGTGLGLAMVRRLAELHGGTVAVTSEPGRGSCFTVWLPWHAAAAPQPAALPQAVPATRDGALALVIEDDVEAADLMRAQLEAEGFGVLVAESAEAALAMAPGVVPELITVDIALPGIDGWEFMAKLKDVPGWEQVPVVVVSVMADHRRGFSLGAALVLQKPVSRDALSSGLARRGLIPGNGRDVTVLAVDDDPNAVELLATHLRQSGYIVLRALSGREGIELAQRFRPDLIALDLEMPDLSGFDVVEALVGAPATAHIPIIIVTAQQLSPEMRKRLNGHIHDIVDKAGFDSRRFIGEVRRALVRKREAAQPQG